ncbi:tetratricopeptide repeat protein [Puniceicoccales bacterium CK1056]|uniref:Tetratricopeptide repeat protein n=1 Tax=Oceanipulchritudo coccoides TaxID=2706888 RepID=A0A6B2M0L8_9BACT|nr:tetratricopeptide repeat protein [Oceanipulchritudo coccoides]NDV61290.1 tetratricopeptide repeat protein [Oceanipulchritudo coccoides]
MKRIITLITLAAASLPATAQQQVISVDTSPAKAFYATDAWNKAFMGYYGVDSGTEPGVTEDTDEREVLGQIREFLQSGSDSGIRSATQAIATLVQQQQAKGVATSPMMLQIAGTLEMRNAEITNNYTEKAQILRRSEDYLRRAIEAFPNFLRAHKNLANLLFRNDRAAEAKKHFIKAVELGDKDAVTYGLLGAIFMEEGKLISSETSLRNSLMINPTILEFKQLLGNVLLQQERYGEAKEVFAELLLKRPNEVNFWMAQSNCYIALDQIDEATRNLEIVRFMGKANVPSLMLLGDVYINKEMIDEATEVYLEAIALDPSDANLSNFIRASETLGNFAAYSQAMSVITKIDGNYKDRLSDEQEIELLSLKSEINISLGKGKEAAGNLEALLKKDPFNARALLSLARYYSDADIDESLEVEQQDLQRSRYQQQAIIYYERAQNLDDQTSQVRAFIGEAQLRVQRDELELAADLLADAQSIQYQDNVQAYLDQIRAALKNRRRS